MPIEFAPPSPSLQGFQIPAPQSTDPLQTLAQIGQLRTQGLQQQGAQQELQLGQIKTQQAQEDMADQQKLRQVYGSWLQSGNPKLDDLVTQAGAAGVGPRTLIPLQQQILEQRNKLATTKEAEFKNTVSAQAQTTQAFNAVASVPPDQPAARAAAWQTERGNLISGGFATPNQIPPDYPGDQAFEELRHHNRTSEQELALVKEQREATAAAATTAEAQQKVALGEKAAAIQEIQAAPVDPQTGAPTPAAMADIQQRHPKVVLPRGPATKDDIARLIRSTVDTKDQPEFDIKLSQAEAMKAFQSQNPAAIDQLVDKIVPPTDPMNSSTKVLLHNLAATGGTMAQVQQAIKDAYDQRGRVQVAKETAQNRQNITIQGMGSVDQPSTMAQMVGDYEVPLQTALARTPIAARNNLLSQIKAINPQFQEQYYQTFQKTENDATSGDLAKSSKALNTMMGHLGVLNQAAEALNNGDIQGLNRIANAIGVQFGSTAKTTYETIVHRLGPEVTNEEDFSSNLSPDQIKQNIGISAYLADSLIKANQGQYERGTYGRGRQKLMTDEAEGTRQRLVQQVPANLRGGGSTQGPPGTVAVPLKDGRTAFLPPDKAAQLKKDHPELVK